MQTGRKAEGERDKAARPKGCGQNENVQGDHLSAELLLTATNFSCSDAYTIWLLQNKYQTWTDKLNAAFHEHQPDVYQRRHPDKVGNKWRNLERVYRVEADKVSKSKQQQKETGAAYTQEESLQYTSDWHLWDIFREINNKSPADQIEQANMGIVSESGAHGKQPSDQHEGDDLTGN